MYNFVNGASNTSSIHLRLVIKLNKGKKFIANKILNSHSKLLVGGILQIKASPFAERKVLRQYFTVEVFENNQ